MQLFVWHTWVAALIPRVLLHSFLLYEKRPWHVILNRKAEKTICTSLKKVSPLADPTSDLQDHQVMFYTAMDLSYK